MKPDDMRNPQTKIIWKLMMQTNTQCQNDCPGCCNTYLRHQQSHYRLSLSSLKNFLSCCVTSGYTIQTLWLNGPGEPLIWKDLQDALRIIRESKVAEKVFIASNGIAVKAVEGLNWDDLDKLRITCYPNQTPQNREALQEIQKTHPKLVFHPVREFSIREDYGNNAYLPCECVCEGPTLLNDRIYYYCGPMVIEAIERAKEAGVEDSRILDVPVEPEFMRDYNPKLRMKLSYCLYCWANKSIPKKVIPHTTRPTPS